MGFLAAAGASRHRKEGSAPASVHIGESRDQDDQGKAEADRAQGSRPDPGNAGNIDPVYDVI